MHVLCRLGALCLGGVFALGQAPFDLWWVAALALVGILWLTAADKTARSAGWSGWLFGVGYFALSMHWIVEPFAVDPTVTWMAPFALVGLAAGLASLWAIAFWAGRRLSAGPFGIALCWAAMELARAYILTGFPWGLVGYVWAQTPVAQWHAIIGPHCVTLVTLLLAACAAWAISARSFPVFFVTVLVSFNGFIAGMFLYPGSMDPTGFTVRLIQPNAPQDQKWDRDFIPIFFNRQVDFTAQNPKPDLIVWPETAVPNLLDNAGPAFEVIAEAADGTPVVLGIQREENGRYYNSLITLNEAGQVADLYDKHHLVPFGEYMPAASFFARFNILGLATRAEAGYSSGPGPALIDLGPLGTALPLICYEAVFPQDVNGAPERPRMLLQITNDAWFGINAGPQQHLAQARLRAIEQRLPMIRVANTGISAVIDPAGGIVDALPLGRAGFLDVPLPPALSPSLYSRTGDWLALAALFVSFAALLMFKSRRPIDPPSAGA
ncbi:apolipoprotein N-acyltransferase [Marivita sp. XM-24bin2]|jgi:apolipoprotein N-acyltransferase|uniref:apolipoprotein N-acyltransferase n=1 Tax=unclassified Marivita TaxID=2632480 RepID=UPI000D7B7023|nr:apolipoprotein N-acyltransferase [Marivita sp. XM-24bin2]MCR9109452.1 apolipoprotein N-acyltransferase [Paracoccaceae bacterium]PWL35350.1 MAG: apolipoprotein N-acyltransferase [Marivita sp. XM-24bin2]